MFRMDQMPDVAEEKKLVQESVRRNLIAFALICTAIRISNYIKN